MSDSDKFLIELLQEMRDDIKELRSDSKEMKSDINVIKLTDMTQNEQLAYHIKRTDLAEENLIVLREYIDRAIERLDRKPFDWKKFISWAVGLSVPISGLIVALSKSGII